MIPLPVRRLLLITLLISSCQLGHQDDIPKKYGLISCLDPETRETEYYFQSNDFATGDLSQAKPGPDLPAVLFDYKNERYFGIGYGNDDLFRFMVKDGQLVETGRLHLDKDSVFHKTSSWYAWAGRDTLFIGSSMSGRHFEYCLINTTNMQLIRKGHINIPLPGKDLNYGGIFGRLQGHQLYLAYTIYDYWAPSKPAPSDTMWLATLHFPDMTIQSITPDARSTFPGGYLLAWDFGLTFKNDIYLITQTGGRTREHPTAPDAVFRIKQGAQTFDTSYFFSLADKKTREAYGLYDLGNGLAITKVVNKTDIGETMDYMVKNVAAYYLADLIHQTTTKLDLPKDILDFRKNILVEGNHIYIAIYNPATKQSNVWDVNRQTLKTSKGLSVPGHVVQIFRQ